MAGLHGDWIWYFGWWPIVVIAGLILFAAGYWWWDSTAEERHTHAMAKFARINKWDYQPETREYRQALRSFPFDQGINQRDLKRIEGTFNGRRCSTFTHQYEMGAEDKKRRTDRWQITAVELEYPLQTLDIVPDDYLAKSAKLFGGQDIDFESAAFNKKWRVVGRNPKYAHDIVHPRMMERLLKPDADGLAIRVEGPYILCWQWNRQGPADLARRLGVLTSMAKLIPAFVLKEFEYEHKKNAEAKRLREKNAPDWATTPYALTSGKYTGIGAENYPEVVELGKNQGSSLRDEEDRAW